MELEIRIMLDILKWWVETAAIEFIHFKGLNESLIIRSWSSTYDDGILMYIHTIHYVVKTFLREHHQISANKLVVSGFSNPSVSISRNGKGHSRFPCPDEVHDG